MSGPRAATFGTETTLTCNYIAKSGGGDHLYDSCIVDDGTTTCIKNDLVGTGTACFGGTVCTSTISANACINIGTNTSLGSRLSIQSANDQAGITMFNTFDCNKWSLRTGTTGISNKGFGIVDDICNTTRVQINSSGYVGINTITPLSRFDIALQSGESFTIGNCSNTITCGDLIGSLTFVSRDVSTNSTGGIAGIRSYATQTYNTGGVEGDLRFYVSAVNTQPNGTILSGQQVLRLSQDGIACFSCQICTPSGIFSCKIGIGTSSLNRLISMQGPAESWIENITTQPTVQCWLFGQDGTRKGFEVYDLNTSLTRFFIAPSTGNVGISNTSPTAPLTFCCTTGTKIDFYNDGTNRYAVQVNSGELRFLTCTTDYIHLAAGNSTGLVVRSGAAAIGSTVPNATYLQLGDWCNRGGRLLTSNNAQWIGDGPTPLMVITSGNSTSTCKGQAIGLALHNDSQTCGSYTPILAFSRRSYSGIYNSTMAAIMAQSSLCGPDANWNGGDLVFTTTPNGGYMCEAMRVTGNGSIGIGEASPGTDKMVINGGSANSNIWLRLKTDGSHGIKPSIHFDSGLVGTNRPSKVVIMGGYSSPDGGGGGALVIYTNDTSEVSQQRMCIDPRGAVTIMGALAKGSGSFRICHPLSSKANTHALVHSFIEGPNADLIYSGHIKLTNGIGCINIDCVSRMTQGTFEALNRCVRIFTTNETSWDAVRGKVYGNVVVIESQNNTSEDEISWMVIGERQDQHMFDTDWTDNEGKVITEPELVIVNDDDII